MPITHSTVVTGADDPAYQISKDEWNAALSATTPYAIGSLTVADGNYLQMVRELVLVSTDRLTLTGTARLRID
jgi:hypothetical protein